MPEESETDHSVVGLGTGVNLGRPVQVAYAVGNLASGIERWQARGVGPFVVRPHIPVDESVVFGTHQRFDHSSAFAWWGPPGSDSVMVELICEHPGDAGRQLVPISGMHHLAFFVDDFETAAAALTDHGWPPALRARAGATWFGFHDARDELGHFVEIYEPSPGLLGFYDTVKHLIPDT